MSDACPFVSDVHPSVSDARPSVSDRVWKLKAESEDDAVSWADTVLSARKPGNFTVQAKTQEMCTSEGKANEQTSELVPPPLLLLPTTYLPCVRFARVLA